MDNQFVLSQLSTDTLKKGIHEYKTNFTNLLQKVGLHE